MSLHIFSDDELEQIRAIHPGYCTVAQELERATNNLPFAEGLLETLLVFVRDRRDQERELFNTLMKGSY